MNNRKKNRFANISACKLLAISLFTTLLMETMNSPGTKGLFSHLNTDDDNRVILNNLEEADSDYINASYVDVSIHAYNPVTTESYHCLSQGYSIPKKFIAAQGMEISFV